MPAPLLNRRLGRVVVVAQALKVQLVVVASLLERHDVIPFSRGPDYPERLALDAQRSLTAEPLVAPLQPATA